MASTPLPPTFVATVASLHRVAEQIVSPARKPDEEISLQATPGGYGTPVFEFDGVEHQVRVDGAELVHRAGDPERRVALTTLGDARQVVADLLPGSAGSEDGTLEIDPSAARILADWYALGDVVLGELVAGADAEDAPSPVRLWPEHFDIAIELGDEAGGQRGITASPRATTTTSSPTPTSDPGRPRSRASSGTPPDFAAPSSLTPSWSRRRTHERSHSISSPRERTRWRPWQGARNE